MVTDEMFPLLVHYGLHAKLSHSAEQDVSTDLSPDLSLVGPEVKSGDWRDWSLSPELSLPVIKLCGSGRYDDWQGMTFNLEVWEAALKVQCVRIGHLSDEYAKQHNKEALYITSVTTNCC